MNDLFDLLTRLGGLQFLVALYVVSFVFAGILMPGDRRAPPAFGIRPVAQAALLITPATAAFVWAIPVLFEL